MKSNIFAKSYHTKLGAFIFYTVSMLAVMFWYGSEWTYSWLPEYYGDAFIPVVTTLVWLCVLANFVFLAGHKNFKDKVAICNIHTGFCILAGVLCGFTFILMTNITQGFGDFWGNLPFVLPVLPYIGFAVGSVFVLAIFLDMKRKQQIAVCGIVITAIIIPMVINLLTPIMPLEFSTQPLVLDIGGDRYSVIFATNKTSIGYLEYEKDGETLVIPDESYVRMNTGRVHRFVIPRDDLNGNDYTIRAREILSINGTGADMGKEIASPVYSFRGEYKDALNIIFATDMHDMPDKLVAAAANFENPYLMMILGDFASNYNTEEDLIDDLIGGPAAATKGEYPAIFARGNHEISGYVPDLLYRELGMDSFYYQVERGSYLFTITDGGADWDCASEGRDCDGCIQTEFDVYRQAQLDWLAALPVPDKDVTHFAALHIPDFDYGGTLEAKTKFYSAMARLNVDMQFSGHDHQLEYIPPFTAEYGERKSDKFSTLPYPLLICGGPVGGGYSGEYECVMVSVTPENSSKIMTIKVGRSDGTAENLDFG